jgi:glutaminyl-peptide cyclotransferase
MKKTVFSLLVSILLFSCNGGDDPGPGNGNPPEAVPPIISYGVTNSYPHDTASFVQGLWFHQGKLYESTGSPVAPSNNGSWLGPVDLKTGKAEKKVTLPNDFFGEGSTLLNNRVYYITYQKKQGFVYEFPSFKKLRDFNYATEGWGLTNDGKNLIMSDGSNSLYFYNPETFQVQNILGVVDNNGPVPNLNELEFIAGFIYANQWQTNYILKIDPASGTGVGRMAFDSLDREVKAKFPEAEYLNGIAYDSTSNRIFITGKKWPTLYEIKMQ